ncbi:MAG: trypsin-like peptidase domain-containing protein [Pirellulaceae bacterium]
MPRFAATLRRRFALALLTALAACFSSVGQSSWGQTWPEQPPTPEARAKLYQELADEVAALERHNILKRVVRLVTPTVVHIDAEKAESSEFRRRSVEEAGSGVIIELGDKKYVLTNRHVITNASLRRIKIKLADGRVINPARVWEDAETDVAVMVVTADDLVPARIGDSKQMEIGDFVLAVGSPFGLSHSVTYGIISAKGRRDLELGEGDVTYQDFMQTDAAINPGNSGGPLMNLRGEVVGINTAIASSSGGSEGIGFTIPINMAIHVARQLIETGRVARAFLGVQLDSRFGPEAAAKVGLPRPIGARVSGVTEDSPAEAAKLQVGDVIVRFDGDYIDDDNHLVNRVSMTPVGKAVDVLIFRDGKPLTLQVQVGERKVDR